MKTPIAALLGVAVTAGMTLVSVPAHATCTQTIYAERSVASAASTQLLGRTTSITTVIWFGTATDAELQNAIATAVSQRNRVTVTGNATSCSNSGTFRNLGIISRLIISP